MSLLETGEIGSSEATGLSPRGLEVLRTLDSRCFGFLGIQSQQHSAGKESHIGQEHPHEANFVSREFIHKGIQKLRQDLNHCSAASPARPELLCQIGHLHLLLEEYKQALSAYQLYQRMYPVESSTNVKFLYGIGLIYFHMNSYKWGIDVFRNVLQLSPTFARSIEVHLRLAIMHKKRGDYHRSLDHFRKSLCIPGPSSFNKLEIQFHIGHVCFLQGNFMAAKESFERILSSKAVPNHTKAMALKQLGWLYHSVPEISATTPDPHTKAIELLTLSVGANPSSGQAWYFLGRCHAHQGSVHEAFLAYQYAISKAEDNQADTWCSIGLLYHKMLQPKDSLQSYLCAVYLDPHNLASWVNMGCLYEAMAQPVDALLTYKNAAIVVRTSKKCPVKCSEHVFSRISNLEQYLFILGPSVHHQPHSLPSLYEAWNTLIPSNVREKRSPPSSPLLHLPISPTFSPHSQLPNFASLPPSPITPHTPFHSLNRPLAPPIKRARVHKSKDPIIIKNINEGWNKQGVVTSTFNPSPAFHFGTESGMIRNRSETDTGSPRVVCLDDMGEVGPRVDPRSMLGVNCRGGGFGTLSSLPPHSAIGSFIAEPPPPPPPSNPAQQVFHSPPLHRTQPHRRPSPRPAHLQLNVSGGSPPIQKKRKKKGLPVPSRSPSECSSPHSGRTLSSPSPSSRMGPSLSSPSGRMVPSLLPSPSPSDCGTPPLPMLDGTQTHLLPSSSRRRLASNRTSLAGPGTSSDYSIEYISASSVGSSSSSNSPLPPPPSASASPSPSPLPSLPSKGPVLLAASSPIPLSSALSLGLGSPMSLPSPMTVASLPSLPSPMPLNTSLGSPMTLPSPRTAASLPLASPMTTGSPVLLSSSLPPASPMAAPSPTLLVSPMTGPMRVECIRNESHNTTPSSSFCFSPHSFPSSEPPFSPLIGGGISSAFNTNFSPSPFSNPALSYYDTTPTSLNTTASSHHNVSADIPDDLSTVDPIKVGGEIRQVGDYLDQFWNQNQDSGVGKSRCHGDIVGTTSRYTGTGSDVTGVGVAGGFPSDTAGKGSRLLAGDTVNQEAGAVSPKVDAPSSSEVALSQSQDIQVKRSSPTQNNTYSLKETDNTAGGTGTESLPAPHGERSKSLQSDTAEPRDWATPHMPQGKLLTVKETGEMLTVFQDFEVPFFTEEISDSGVSSLGIKQCSSENSSPCETTSPALVPALPHPVVPPSSRSPSASSAHHFSYPSTSYGAPAPHKTRPPLLDPILEPFLSLCSEAEYMRMSPELRPPNPPRYRDGMDLNPKVEIYEVKDSADAHSMELHAFCNDPDRPICIMRGLCSMLGVNIDLFSSENLVRTCPDHEMEVREQIQQAADENSDPTGQKQVWKCESSRSSTTIQEYAQYQNRVYLGQDDSAQSDSSDSPGGDSTARPLRKQVKKIRFGTNVDLSDSTKWRAQLQELDKLPKFTRVSCPEADFLPHIGHTILGMNSVQLYMKVPGARTPGHQENNNFCSLNINIGPGDCEWFAVHNQYWGVFHKLCEKRKLCFLTGSWWPILSELAEMKVPVYRFTQYVGDVVWLNPGTVHWVQANNVCNNIAWNIGPLTAHQFRMSWERYQWNKIQRVRSIVPMVHMTWNLVQNIKIVNETLFQQLKSLLKGSLLQTRLLLTHLKNSGIPVHWHGREEGEPAPCCNSCLDEVFNVLFVLNHRGEYLVYCHKCASALKKSFTVLQQYKLEELDDIVANFKLHPSMPTPLSNPQLV